MPTEAVVANTKKDTTKKLFKKRKLWLKAHKYVIRRNCEKQLNERVG